MLTIEPKAGQIFRVLALNRSTALRAKKGKQFENISDISEEIRDLAGLRIIRDISDDTERTAGFIKGRLSQLRKSELAVVYEFKV